LPACPGSGGFDPGWISPSIRSPRRSCRRQPRGEVARARQARWEFSLGSLRWPCASCWGDQFRIGAELQRSGLDWLEQPLPPFAGPPRACCRPRDLERCLPMVAGLYCPSALAVPLVLGPPRRPAGPSDGPGQNPHAPWPPPGGWPAWPTARHRPLIARARLMPQLAPGSDRTRMQLELISWAELPAACPPAETVFAGGMRRTMARNLGAAAPRALFGGLARSPPSARHFGCLTGTPMKKPARPAQLFPLLMAIGHPLGLNQLGL